MELPIPGTNVVALESHETGRTVQFSVDSSSFHRFRNVLHIKASAKENRASISFGHIKMQWPVTIYGTMIHLVPSKASRA